MISVVFTRSKLPGSKLIRWLYGGLSSHMAIVLDDRLVFHSNFSGTQLKWLSSFMKKNEFVFQSDLYWLIPEEEELIYQRLIKYDEKKYDFKAGLYLLFAGLFNRILGTKIPKSNPWSDKRAYLCIELIEVLSVIGLSIGHLDIMFPDHVYYQLRDLITERIKSGNIPSFRA